MSQEELQQPYFLLWLKIINYDNTQHNIIHKQIIQMFEWLMKYILCAIEY